ncbi:hypothetical protein [Blastopirellula marina]|uniref:Uncharacterized protein n=1 Tax=Blastopirellula marina DSM 3645 TaxID=314230 RepID=A3ZRS8_9BACT|nr:hypothetical protein [Blastopirellula marina]EAQ80847.1 hypothetical protein DSM3645_12541 [Blastopirellula marina DSM 3645]
MDWFLRIAPLSRHALTAGACLVGALGMSTFALAEEAPIAPLTEQELAAESYQVDFKPPARGDKEKGDKDQKEKGDKEKAERRASNKPGEHGDKDKGEKGKEGEAKGEHRGHGQHGMHDRHGKPGMHHAWGGHRSNFGGHGFHGSAFGGTRSGHPGFGGHAMRGMAMQHGFGPMHGGHGHAGFGPGHGKSAHADRSPGMADPRAAMMRQQMQIQALEQKVERLANAIRGGHPEVKKPEHAPGHHGAAKPGMPGVANPSVAIHRLMAENAQLKQKVARLENAMKADKPEGKKDEAKKEESARRPDAAGPRGPMMRGGLGGFSGRGFEGMRGPAGPRGPIARGPRDGERERPQAGPRDGERRDRERGKRDEDRKESDRRSENRTESREGFVLDTNGDGFNDSPAEVAEVVVEVAVVDAE